MKKTYIELDASLVKLNTESIMESGGLSMAMAIFQTEDAVNLGTQSGIWN